MSRILQAGDLLDGRYTIERQLGSGGFAVVYEAVDAQTSRHVALKLLTRPESGYDRALRLRFGREADALARLQGPNVARLLDRGETTDGLLYLVLEFVEGDDLSDMRAPVEEAIAILRQALQALDEAHKAGVLHRDIKPANLRMEWGSGHVKLLDFGIARMTDDGSPALTKTGELIGTPRYMSPEQLTGKALTPASDIYSLGLVTLELLLGGDALHGWSLGEQLQRVRPDYELPAGDVGGHGADLLEILRRMTAAQPSERFRSAAAVLRALDELEGANTVVTHGSEVLRASTRDLARSSLTAKVIAVAALTGFIGIGIAFFISTPTEPAREVPAARAPVNRGALLKASARETTVAASVIPVADAGVLAVDGGSPCAYPPDVRGHQRLFGTDVHTYVPDVEVGRKMPVLVMIHGNGLYAEQWLRNSGFPRLADEHQFMIVAPQDRIYDSWELEEDVERLRAIRDVLAETYCVDLDRFFLVTQEGGGTLAYRASCEGWVSAIATHAYNRRVNDRLKCDDTPTPALVLLPLQNTWLPPEGGLNCKGSAKMSFDVLEDLWRERNHCEGAAESLYGGTCNDWRCEAPLRFCRLEGGGVWPNAQGIRLGFGSCEESFTRPPAPLAEIVWSFFSSLEGSGEGTGGTKGAGR